MGINHISSINYFRLNKFFMNLHKRLQSESDLEISSRLDTLSVSTESVSASELFCSQICPQEHTVDCTVLFSLPAFC